ncbi:MAG: hypothetical protein NTW49_12110 [Bacteroidia bacterium]|nr:hypothetical protein [Bacteroidia bacterium]
MKTTILICLAFIMSLSYSFANSIKEVKPKSEVVKYVQKMVKYPGNLVDSKVNGNVYVTFKVDNSGNILVDKINSDDPNLKAYVTSELAKLKIDFSKVKIDDFDHTYEVNLKFQVVE